MNRIADLGMSSTGLFFAAAMSPFIAVGVVAGVVVL